MEVKPPDFSPFCLKEGILGKTILRIMGLEYVFMGAAKGCNFMKFPKRWRTGFAYITIILVLGLTALTYGLARLNSLPKGQEVVAQGNEQTKEQSVNLNIENQVETKEQGESKSQPEIVNQAQTKVPETNSQIPKLTVKDFPCPVQVEPIRDVGNYYSENLNAYLFHAGRDYPLAEGAVIRATHGGKVTFAGADPILGKKVEIDCGENWHVVYGGLDNLRVQQGEIIESNAVLGQIGYYPGADGISDQPQLHYEIWDGDQAQMQ